MCYLFIFFQLYYRGGRSRWTARSFFFPAAPVFQFSNLPYHKTDKREKKKKWHKQFAVSARKQLLFILPVNLCSLWYMLKNSSNHGAAPNSVTKRRTLCCAECNKNDINIFKAVPHLHLYTSSHKCILCQKLFIITHVFQWQKSCMKFWYYKTIGLIVNYEDIHRESKRNISELLL